MISKDFFLALEDLEREKGISKELFIQELENALACACKNGDSSNPSGTADAAASSQSTGSAATSEPKDSYKEIACEKVVIFKEQQKREIDRK